MNIIKKACSKLRKRCFEHLVEQEVSKRVEEALKNRTHKQRQIYADLINERNHIENLLNSRFNFFIVVFATMLASILVVKSIPQLQLVLFPGTLILILLFWVIARAQKKLSIHLKKIREEHKCSAEAFAHQKANTEGCYLTRCSVNGIIGYFLPLIIVIIMLFASIASFFCPEKLRIFWERESSETLTKYINYNENHFHKIKYDEPEKFVTD